MKLPIRNYQFTINLQLPFAKPTPAKCKLIIDNLLKTENCKLKIATGGGLA